MSSPSNVRFPSQDVPLPDTVEAALRNLCADQSLPEPTASARRKLASLSEESALQVVRKISEVPVKRSLDGFIGYMVAKQARISGGSASPSSVKSSSCVQKLGGNPSLAKSLTFNEEGSISSPIMGLMGENMLLVPRNGINQGIDALEALNELEFRKVFLLLCYVGRERIDQVFSAETIRQLKDLRMADFETKVWEILRENALIKEEDRCRDLEWDSGKTHFYHCHVSSDGNYQFKGPFLNKTRTLLQKTLGDENVLLVKLERGTDQGFRSVDPTGADLTDSFAIYRKIAKDGICIGSHRYRFFVFKDGGKEERKKDPTTSSVKCYFVNLEGNKFFSNKSVQEARCFFMHAHELSSLSNYMICLDVDLGNVNVEVISDIECKDENGNTIYDKKGKPMIHTDGTGFVSVDIALKCPGNIFKGNFLNRQSTEAFVGCGAQSYREVGKLKSRIDDPPLLIQCRLFHEGCAVKGTLLVNKKLKEKTIQVRPSMIKVDKDPQLANMRTVNSLEIVGTSNKPKHAYLSKTLIALLSYGGVPNKYSGFTGECAGRCMRCLLKQTICIERWRMRKKGTLQSHLSILVKEEKKSLRGGRIPIADSYYLMGTADPTGSLKPDECIYGVFCSRSLQSYSSDWSGYLPIDCGQISGEVLVYRNPGLHFGDIHVLKATYIKEMEAYVGNSKYGIFFPSVGLRSLADEIAGGDFDGDMYWISRNPQLLKYFKPSMPWTPAAPPQNVNIGELKGLTADQDQLENELIDLWLTARFRPSYAVSMAADSWQALMDRLLMIGDDLPQEKYLIEQNLLRLVDIYYDALDQLKKGGQKIEVPRDLRADVFPHYMGREESYHSTSILGLIYDTVTSYQEDVQTVTEVWKLPCFEVEVAQSSLIKWTDLYDSYRKEMAGVMNHVGEDKTDAADKVIEKYKKILYGAAEFEESPRNIDDVLDEALAIYNITYDYAKLRGSVRLCSFAWRVAGPALCNFYARKQGGKSITCLPSVLREIWS
ncbi:hypothetical protein SAY87_002079 [Trapa incisa]|uniref:RNA-dependent RNA polymerase n=1 Tax=Trapa incisa TaxID=236973 RepID=A0AAN7JSN2_9MYRT|nr:hypothetical protein SAY87_002079 [Trapa incisa]